MAEEAQEEGSNEKMRRSLMKRIKAQQIEQQKREVVKKYLTPEAYERLMNVRISNYELYAQLLDLVISLIQNNRVVSKLTEAQLKGILEKLTYKPESSIEFKHK